MSSPALRRRLAASAALVWRLAGGVAPTGVRRLAMAVVLAGAALVAGCGSGSEPAGGERQAVPTRPRPNIVVIMADDLGYGDISPYGGWIETPALDAMAAEGLRFTDFHSSGAVCSPTRAGLLTGRYQQRAGIPNVIYANPAWNRHHGLQPRETTIAERIQAEGYATGIAGKWHLGYGLETNPLRHGFDVFHGYVSGNVDYFSHVDGFGNHDWWDGETNREEPGYVTHLINDHAVAFIEERAGSDRPFFLYVAHEAPHFPYQGPDDAAFRVVGERIPETREPAQVRRAYREMVEEMDAGIGAILDTLRRLGLAERTFVFFLSDNGATPAGSNGPLRGFKASLWEGGHRVPALAWWPGAIAAGGTTGATMTSIDLAATVLDVADVLPPEERPLDGVSLLPHLLGGAAPEERPLFWAYQQARRTVEQAAMRQGPWKLIVNGPDGPEVGLYNLDDDPGETVNLAGDERERVAAMREALEDWRLEVEEDATVQPAPPFLPGAAAP